MEEPTPHQLTEFVAPEFAHRQLTDEHRELGFITPPRETYIHVGRAVCGVARGTEHIDRPMKRDGRLHVCTMDFGHAGECWETTKEVDFNSQILRRLGGCNQPTTMSAKYVTLHAKDPKCRKVLYCSTCDKKRPISEFVWLDGQEHGADPIHVGDTHPKTDHLPRTAGGILAD